MIEKRVLVIDNDETLVEFQSIFFESQGYTVYTASDGDVGVQLALEHRPPAIICDVIMGQMHGFEVLQALRARPELRDTIIIMTSAKSFKPDIDRARQLGATEYVVKPFRAEELLALIEQHLAAPGASSCA